MILDTARFWEMISENIASCCGFELFSCSFIVLFQKLCEILSSLSEHRSLHLLLFLLTLGKHILNELMVSALILNEAYIYLFREELTALHVILDFILRIFYMFNFLVLTLWTFSCMKCSLFHMLLYYCLKFLSCFYTYITLLKSNPLMAISFLTKLLQSTLLGFWTWYSYTCFVNSILSR